MKRNVFLISLLIICLTMTYSQENNNAEFSTWDGNKDGNIDHKEILTVSRIFQKLDTDGDNNMSAIEFQDALFKLTDLNHDFKISKDEWDKINDFIETQSGKKPIDMASWDADKNNFVDINEFNSKVSGFFGEWEKSRDKALSRTEFYDGVFEWWDLDKNGSISEDEFNEVKGIIEDEKSLFDLIFVP